MGAGLDDGSGVGQRMWWRGFPARLMLLVGVVLGLVMGVLVSPAAHPEAHATAGVAIGTAPSHADTRPWAQPSAKAQPAPMDRGSADARHAAPGQPIAETARAFGSSALAADATEGSDRSLFGGRSRTTLSCGAIRRVLDTVAPRLGRAPPSYRVS